MCPFLPDSPRLLIRNGKYDDAYDVIAALQSHGATPDSPSVKAQFNVIKDILDREHMNTCSWWQLLTGHGPAGVLRRMILGAWMQAMNQVSGINVTSYYMSYVFINALGISNILSRILAACGSVDYLIFACSAQASLFPKTSLRPSYHDLKPTLIKMSGSLKRPMVKSRIKMSRRTRRV